MAFNSTKLNSAIRDLTNWVRTGVGKKADKTYVDGLVAEGVKSKTSTETVSLAGDGRGTALSANLKIDPRPNNRIRVYPGAGIGVFDEAPPDIRAQYVNSSTGSDANTGTKLLPLKTIDKAMDRIIDSGGVGSFNIYLKCGQVFPTDGYPRNIDNAQIGISGYDDPKYFDGGDSTAGPAYYAWVAADYQRPTIRFNGVPSPAFPQYRVNTVYYAKTFTIVGVKLELPKTAATSPGYPWYSLSTENSAGRVWLAGCDIVYGHNGLQALSRAGSIWTQGCNLSGMQASNFLGSDVPMYVISGDTSHATVYVPLDPKYPTFTGRVVNTRAMLNPDNINVGSSASYDTKTLFGTNVNYDIFVG